MGVVGDSHRELRRDRKSPRIRSWPRRPARRPARRAGRRGRPPGARQIRLASWSAAAGLMLKKRRYRLSGDIARCISRTGLEVAGCGRADLGRRPIGEQRVHAGRGLGSSHRSSGAGLPFSQLSPLPCVRRPGTNGPAEGAEGRWADTARASEAGTELRRLADRAGPPSWPADLKGRGEHDANPGRNQRLRPCRPCVRAARPGARRPGGRGGQRPDRRPDAGALCWSSTPPTAGSVTPWATGRTHSPWTAGRSPCCPPATRPASTGAELGVERRHRVHRQVPGPRGRRGAPQGRAPARS